MDYKKIYEESNVLLPFSPDVKVQQDQQEKMVVMGFPTALPSEYDSVRHRFCPALKFLLSKKRSVEYFAQKYPRLLFHLPR